MKVSLLALLAVCVAVFAAGCEHLASMAPGPDDRVLSGVVTTKTGGGPLPPGSEVEVRLVDVSRGESRGEVLGEATIKDATSMPVPFRIEYRAGDVVLMRSGLNVEARVSVGGRLRYTTTTGHPVTLSNVNDSHVVEVDFAASRR
jgi:uncharacterized lipoprotein YbaY